MMSDSLPAVRDAQARNILVTANLDLVPWAIFMLRPRLRWLRRFLDYGDIIQEGRRGLLRAAELWREDLGTFSTYATPAIRRHAVRAAHRVARHFHSVLPIHEIAPDSLPADC